MKSLLVQDIAKPTSSVTLSILRVGTNTDRSSSVNTQLADLIVSNIQEKAPQAAFSSRYLSQLPINEINEAFFEGVCLEASKRTNEQMSK